MTDSRLDTISATTLERARTQSGAGKLAGHLLASLPKNGSAVVRVLGNRVLMHAHCNIDGQEYMVSLVPTDLNKSGPE